MMGIISKVSGMDEMDYDGFQECGNYMNQTCFGVMRVPIDQVKDASTDKDSQELIEDGIQWLMNISRCVCEARSTTKLNSADASDIRE